jgi:hypothetical protein
MYALFQQHRIPKDNAVHRGRRRTTQVLAPLANLLALALAPPGAECQVGTSKNRSDFWPTHDSFEGQNSADFLTLMSG